MDETCAFGVNMFARPCKKQKKKTYIVYVLPCTVDMHANEDTNQRVGHGTRKENDGFDARILMEKRHCGFRYVKIILHLVVTKLAHSSFLVSQFFGKRRSHTEASVNSPLG